MGGPDIFLPVQNIHLTSAFSQVLGGRCTFSPLGWSAMYNEYPGRCSFSPLGWSAMYNKYPGKNGLH
jgi:hypothetical protein